jgi:hypothetical protein
VPVFGRSLEGTISHKFKSHTKQLYKCLKHVGRIFKKCLKSIVEKTFSISLIKIMMGIDVVIINRYLNEDE